jgi:hypothetical protein
LHGQHFFKGVQIGIGASSVKQNNKISFPSSVKYYPIPSFQASLVWGIEFGKFRMSIEPGYEQNGFEVKFDDTKYNHTVKYDFIQIPLNVQYEFLQKTLIGIGVQANYIVKAKDALYSDNFHFKYGFRKKIISAFTSIDHQFGKSFIIGFRYTQDLNGIFNYYAYDLGGLPDYVFYQYTKALYLNFRYNF